ncbi:MAG: T9SS type A sorting domain-containing protein, partial [Candidatus Kapabacteria bacterium]|nr:T9SS type A sorting domain-containing protein [Candidatus Kapabacteria bacterium]
SISELTELNGSAHIEIFNYLGRRLYSNDIMLANTSISENTILKLDNVGFTTGTYYVKITSEKIVKFGSFNL